MAKNKQNPKAVQAQKEGKVPFEYLVHSVLADDAHVHKHGGDKYGIRNWTVDEILASTYVGAIMRHFSAWAQGEDTDPASGRPHLTHVRACCAVVMDAEKHNKLIDDRGRAESKDENGRVTEERGAKWKDENGKVAEERGADIKISFQELSDWLDTAHDLDGGIYNTTRG